MTMKIQFKKFLIAGFCHGLLPMALVDWCFIRFKLGGV